MHDYRREKRSLRNMPVTTNQRKPITFLLGENIRTILFYALQGTLWGSLFPLPVISVSTMVVVNLVLQYLYTHKCLNVFLEGLMLKLKLQYFGHVMQRTDLGKDPDAGKDWRWEEKGTVEDEMVGWHYWLDGHESEQALGTGDGQGSLTCYSPWGQKESDTAERLNWTDNLLCPQI